MRRLFILMGLFSFFLIMGSVQAEPILNGSFETSNCAASWTPPAFCRVANWEYRYGGTIGGKINITDSDSFDGTNSTLFSGSCTNGCQMYLFQINTTEYNNSITFYVKGTLAGGSTFEVYVRNTTGAYGGSDYLLKLENVVFNNWTLQTVIVPEDRQYQNANSTVVFRFQKPSASEPLDDEFYLDLVNSSQHVGTPMYYNLSMIVMSSTETRNNTNCPLVLGNSTVRIGGETQYVSSDNLKNCCFDNGLEYDCDSYLFNLTGGTYDINVEHTGYRPYEASVILDRDMGWNVWLEKPADINLNVYVKNATGDFLGDAKGTLYYANGSIHESTHLFDTNPIRTAEGIGLLRWSSIPIDSYYFVIQKNGYSTYKSPIFYFGEDREFTVVITRTDIDITLTVDKTGGSTLDKFNFTISLTGLTPPIYQASLWTRFTLQDEEVQISSPIQILTDEYNFTLYAKNYFEQGTNCVWIEYDDHISNEECIEIFDVVGEPSSSDSLIDLSPYGDDAGWVSMLLTPFSIITMMLVGVGAYFEAQVKDAKGGIFLAVIIIGVLGFTYLGIYPAWIGVLIAIVCAGILSKFVMNLW